MMASQVGLQGLRNTACCAAVVILTSALAIPDASSAEVAFPSQRPRNANFNRPADGSELDISPPGFCWWRAGDRDSVTYQLTIRDQDDQVVYQSPILADPAHVPTEILPPGDYTWTVSAIVDEQVATELKPREFRILADAAPLPWVPPTELLQKIPAAHPRLLFPAAGRDDIRATLDSTRKTAYLALREIADRALALERMPKPTFDRFDRKTEYAQRRTAYRASYHLFTRTYHQGMLPLSAAYVLSGEKHYGEAAKVHLLNLLDWEVDGVASLELGFDEVGLRIQRTAAQAYDWLYDLLTPAERAAVKKMLIAHGNAMLERLKRRDFLNYSAYSHDGRLPGYLVEFAIVLAEEPEAEAWLDYAMRTLLTVFPHWGSPDGGWAEGINYSLSYNDRFITPLHSLYLATGYDVLQKPFFRKFRQFAMYNAAPFGEILPFGDGEQKPVSYRGDELYSILFFHSLKYQDPVTRWWIDLIPREEVVPDRLGVLHRLLLPDTLSPRPPEDLPLDRVFNGIGWSVFHSDMAKPQDDLMVMFKSSPFGSISHSHADQNSFVIMKGGKALAIPGGERYPQHGSPFHKQYTQQTVAHNALLIDGEGQRNQDDTAGGKFVDFRSTSRLAYVAGDASQCYPEPLKKNLRHVVYVRPSLLIVLDEVESAKPVALSWLMHTKEKSVLHPASQSFTVQRDQSRMFVQLASSTADLEISQTNEWPMDPKEGYPHIEAANPPAQWHFSAKANKKLQSHRIAAIMIVGDQAQMPAYKVRETDGRMRCEADLDGGSAIAEINLRDPVPDTPLIHVTFQPDDGQAESLSIP